ncbi:hypothetical protein C7B69_21220, partial [filamentous cyanobacterium Phorm 46]
EEGRRKKEEGRRKKEEGRRKKEEGRKPFDFAQEPVKLVSRLCLASSTSLFNWFLGCTWEPV